MPYNKINVIIKNVLYMYLKVTNRKLHFKCCSCTCIIDMR